MSGADINMTRASRCSAGAWRARRRGVGAGLVALALMAGACSNAAQAAQHGNAGRSESTSTPTAHGSGAGSSTTSTTQVPVTTAIPPPKPKYVVIDGKRIRVPTEIGTYPIKAHADTGQNIIIEPTSFRPATLYAKEKTVVFTNLTNHAVSIQFPDFPSPTEPLESGPIPPGGTFTWTPKTVVAITYTGSNGARAYINVATVGGI